MVDVEQLRDVNERLKPLRKLMADIQLATEMLVDAEGVYKDRMTTIGDFNSQIDGLREELLALQTEHTTASKDTEEDLARMEASKHHAQAEVVVAKERAEAAKQQLRAEYDALRTQLIAEHKAFAENLMQSRNAMQADHDRVKAALDALVADLRHKVTA